MTKFSNNPEIDFVRHEKMRHASVFAVNILYRNMHEHSDFDMNYVLDGRIKIRYQDADITMEKGDFFISNPYEPHELCSLETTPCQLLCLQLSKHFCEDYFPQIKTVLFREAQPKKLLPPEEYRELVKQFLHCGLSYWTEDACFPLDCVAGLCSLFSWLLHHLPYTVIDEKAFDRRRAKHSRARRLRDYVDMHYKEKITLDGMAEAEGLSRTYISHIFSDNLNVTFQEYLNRVRLEHAIHLMLETNLGITDVCMESGFSDNKYLNLMLKKEFGCNASQFRQQYRQADMVLQESLRESGVSQRILSPEEGLAALNKAMTCQASGL